MVKGVDYNWGFIQGGLACERGLPAQCSKSAHRWRGSLLYARAS